MILVVCGLFACLTGAFHFDDLLLGDFPSLIPTFQASAKTPIETRKPGKPMKPTPESATTESGGVPLSVEQAIANCKATFGDRFANPSSEPLAPCQWPLPQSGLKNQHTQKYTGRGIRVGVLDGGIQFDHPDLVDNIDVESACSFIYSHDPLADPSEMGNGDCSNKGAVNDLSGHGTHVASIIASPLNGKGVSGVAPEATIVPIKVCNMIGYCFYDSVADGIRYAADVGVDIINLSLFADPYLYYCSNDKTEHEIYRYIQDAIDYAQRRGVLIINAAGNEADDLRHKQSDSISPNYPEYLNYTFGDPIDRLVGSNCKSAPGEISGVQKISSSGPYDLIEGYSGLAFYSTVGAISVTAPGGDYWLADPVGTPAALVLAAGAKGSAIVTFYLDERNNARSNVIQDPVDGAYYLAIQGTSMASPHAAGIAALWAEKTGHRGASLAATLRNTATPRSCPEDWEKLDGDDQREKCYGQNGQTSFWGSGVATVPQ